MKDLNRVSSQQLFMLWKNLTIGLLTIVAMMAFTRLLPYYLSPIISLFCAAALYTVLYNHKYNESTSCMLVPYVIFFCLLAYSFVTIVINILYVWGLLDIPQEFVFFDYPYLPSLLMMPVSFLVVVACYVQRHRLSVCNGCQLYDNNAYERGKLGAILNHETSLQLINLMVLFGVLTVLIWAYFFLVYVNININSRDWYVFTGLVIIGFVLDEVYFIFRYYNLYLDLKENDELISDDELRDMTAKTYLRYYLICGDYIYLDPKALDLKASGKTVIDTPFFTKRTVNGITLPEVKRIIERMTGVGNGHLRFFYGRKVPDLKSHSLLRYFYFLDGDISDYPNIFTNGVWMRFEDVKKIYSQTPGRLAANAVTDITRMATIILTSKIFDENGIRKNKLKSYNPTFNLHEVRESELDFQDDKWIKISMFNSDTRLFRLKRWVKKAFTGKDNRSGQWG